MIAPQNCLQPNGAARLFRSIGHKQSHARRHVLLSLRQIGVRSFMLLLLTIHLQAGKAGKLRDIQCYSAPSLSRQSYYGLNWSALA